VAVDLVLNRSRENRSQIVSPFVLVALRPRSRLRRDQNPRSPICHYATL
jgi:hypothetical protein